MPDQSPTPHWSSPLTEERLNVFTQIVRETLEKTELEYVFDEASGIWFFTQTPSGKGQLGNLAQMCNPLPLDEWPDLIARHIELIRKAAPEKIDDYTFAQAEPLLRIRLGQKGDLPNSLVGVELTPTLTAYVVIDLPEVVMSVTQEQGRKWLLTEPDMFALALQNTLLQEEASVEEVELPNGAAVLSVESNSFFAATHALAAQRLVPETPQGYLVAVPNRHFAMIRSLRSHADFGAMAPMYFIAQQAHRTGPGSISPNLYWIREGRWSDVKVELTPEGLGLNGPDGLVSLLAGWGSDS